MENRVRDSVRNFICITYVRSTWFTNAVEQALCMVYRPYVHTHLVIGQGVITSLIMACIPGDD